ncbi:contactin-associated protein-like 4 [Gadus chalcogrammus]|uniref:contactin-associated protein-like 4 n=1 Tax=Gadus chalcogrammus TaxID=1042646 RepID=UPI0024C4D967|nr:contactin-associated protein-like 4 [Gadus chalcogrammus]
MDPGIQMINGIILLLASILLMSRGTTGEELCDSPLVSNLAPASFRSSSHLSNSHSAGFAKLNRREGVRSFPGNTNADSVVQHALQQPVLARYLRLVPLEWNPSGRIGLRLETYGCPYGSDVVGFDGASGLSYRPAPGLTPRAQDRVSLKFKTLRSSGTLLQALGADHSLTLELQRGQLRLLLRRGRRGSPPPSEAQRQASLGSLLDDQHWHHVTLERRHGHINLTVDKSALQLHDPAPLSRWEFEQLSVGAASERSVHKGLSDGHFLGCLENLLYNDLNLVELLKHNSPQVTVLGNVTFSCPDPAVVAVTFSSPQSFLQLPGATASWPGALSAGLQFRTWNRAGLLLTFEIPQRGGVVWLYLSEARLHLQVHKAGRTLVELSTGSGLNDGQWHSVQLGSAQGRLTIAVDQEEGETAQARLAFPVTTGSHLFFGGCPAEETNQECRNPFNVFQGCMRLLTLENQLIDLIVVQQRLLGNYSHLYIDMCGIIDRCSPSHCEHGGRCSQSWRSFHCNCSNTGYRGATCHSPVYEASCEAYKHRGNSSGLYHVDLDGSGPIRAQLVYCNMTEEQTWLVIQHNNTERTRVAGSSGRSHHSAYFDYSAEEKQLMAIINQSEHCEQELSYHCRKSRLLNTPVGSPFSWWVGGPGAGGVQSYWGGAVPGSRQCSCGLEESCVDPMFYCNCDADRGEWASDSGLLTHKKSLPVRSLVLGDLHRAGSEAAYRVGPLRCHGDKNFWNAAFFDKETSYLHFPTFRAELSADISFLFKTTASSGVFLENLGIKDFIRIELSSSTEVLFSFDVGNGPLEVRVRAPRPLDDDRWHRVRAERNVKEASLSVDALPVATREAPDDGHVRLQLNSLLFIGGTASRQKGFRGCIRALRLNEETQDLEERARITPGVRPGCPGHCSSYGSLCRHQGRCVERSQGFTCDCGPSAYTGAFCHREVSAVFKSTTSARYSFREPYEQSRNASALSSSIYSEVTLRGEDISLSFRTRQSPALLLYVSSYYKEHLALLINKHDKLEVRYKLDGGRDAEVLRSRVRNLADGQLHTLVVHRHADAVAVQVDQNPREDFNLTADGEFNTIKALVLGRVSESDELDPEMARLASLGFTGCLSVVRFNSISPLKAALLHPDTSPVAISGPLVQSQCGSSAPTNADAAENTHHLSDQSGSVNTGQPLVNSVRTDSALIGGVIAVVVFLTALGLAVVAVFLYRRKETYGNPEVKRTKAEDSPESPFTDQPESHNIPSETAKEFFI